MADQDGNAMEDSRGYEKSEVYICSLIRFRRSSISVMIHRIGSHTCHIGNCKLTCM